MSLSSLSSSSVWQLFLSTARLLNASSVLFLSASQCGVSGTRLRPRRERRTGAMRSQVRVLQETSREREKVRVSPLCLD